MISRRFISGIDIDATRAASFPDDVWSVDGILHVGAIVVNELLGGSRYANDTPGLGPLVRNAVNVEHRVQADEESEDMNLGRGHNGARYLLIDLVQNEVKDVAGCHRCICVRIYAYRERKLTGGWICHVSAHAFE